MIGILNLTVTIKKCQNKYSACLFFRLNTPTLVPLRLMEQPARGKSRIDIDLKETLYDCYYMIEKYIINEW